LQEGVEALEHVNGDEVEGADVPEQVRPLLVNGIILFEYIEIGRISGINEVVVRCGHILIRILYGIEVMIKCYIVALYKIIEKCKRLCWVH
jgi:hypothetical protein